MGANVFSRRQTQRNVASFFSQVKGSGGQGVPAQAGQRVGLFPGAADLARLVQGLLDDKTRPGGGHYRPCAVSRPR